MPANALFATAYQSNDAIRNINGCFKRCRRAGLRSAVYSAPWNAATTSAYAADGDSDVKQLQEDLLQEKADNEQEPDKKKAALKSIIAAYNARYGTNHFIGEFDLYYQDIQKRIKDQQFPNADLPRKGAEKIDITIVVDMLLTGFDSKVSPQLRGQEPQAPRPHRASRLRCMTRSQRHQAPRPDSRFPPAAGRRGRRHCLFLRRSKSRRVWLTSWMPRRVVRLGRLPTNWMNSWNRRGWRQTRGYYPP